MGKLYQKSGEIGDTLITPNMSDVFDVAFIYFDFFDGDPEDEDNPPNLVQPTGGTFQVRTSENGLAYASMPNGESLDVSDEDYIRLNYAGPGKNVRCIPTVPASGGGVTHYRLNVHRSVSS